MPIWHRASDLFCFLLIRSQMWAVECYIMTVLPISIWQCLTWLETEMDFSLKAVSELNWKNITRFYVKFAITSQPPFNLFLCYSHLHNKREVTLTDVEIKIHPPHTFPNWLHSWFIAVYVLVLSKKSHPPHLFQPPRLLEIHSMAMGNLNKRKETTQTAPTALKVAP